MPTIAVHHIQNSAPGPPERMAVATPTMLPVPIVPARAVIRALNGVSSPLSPAEEVRPFQSMENAEKMLRNV